jgi:hypothetical protein
MSPEAQRRGVSAAPIFQASKTWDPRLRSARHWPDLRSYLQALGTQVSYDVVVEKRFADASLGPFLEEQLRRFVDPPLTSGSLETLLYFINNRGAKDELFRISKNGRLATFLVGLGVAPERVLEKWEFDTADVVTFVAGIVVGALRELGEVGVDAVLMALIKYCLAFMFGPAVAAIAVTAIGIVEGLQGLGVFDTKSVHTSARNVAERPGLKNQAVVREVIQLGNRAGTDQTSFRAAMNKLLVFQAFEAGAELGGQFIQLALALVEIGQLARAAKRFTLTKIRRLAAAQPASTQAAIAARVGSGQQAGTVNGVEFFVQRDGSVLVRSSGGLRVLSKAELAAAAGSVTPIPPSGDRGIGRPGKIGDPSPPNANQAATRKTANKSTSEKGTADKGTADKGTGNKATDKKFKSDIPDDYRPRLWKEAREGIESFGVNIESGTKDPKYRAPKDNEQLDKGHENDSANKEMVKYAQKLGWDKSKLRRFVNRWWHQLYKGLEDPSTNRARKSDVPWLHPEIRALMDVFEAD